MKSKTPPAVMDALHLVLEIIDGLANAEEQRKLMGMVAANYGFTLRQAERGSPGGFAPAQTRRTVNKPKGRSYPR